MKKTAIQELMQWMEKNEFMVNKGFIEKLNECLEIEKKHIEIAFDSRLLLTFKDTFILNGEDYYNQTYKQNK